LTDSYNLIYLIFDRAYVIRNLAYHISANRGGQQKLLQELKSVMPHPGDPVELQKLESLPYLTAVIREGLRITHPVSHRISRIFPEKTLVYDGKPIPPGTVVHMSAILIHENKDIFTEAKTFRPERWLQSDGLQRYLVTFSRGSRSCLGINLAWAEMYLIIAKIFRQFDLNLDEVIQERDIDVARDVIIGVPRSDSKGIIVQVLKVDE
jgi:cytochrome P450